MGKRIVESGISFIISTRFASEILEILLDSLERSKNYDNELKIICDNPSWQTLKFLQDRGLIHGRDYYIVNHGHLDQNLDWGVTKATKDYICLTPDDIVFCKDFDKIILEEMKGSKNRIVTPSYYIGAEPSNRMARDYGWPNWKYYKREKKKGQGFDFEKFDKEPQPPVFYATYYSKSCPTQIMHKETYKRINGLTFCSPHPQGHEIEMMTRAIKYGVERVFSRKALVYHFGGIGNKDMQKTAMGNSHGHFRCSLCGFLDPSEGHKEHFGTERGRIALETGLYLCQRCKKDGWKINETTAELERNSGEKIKQ